MKRFLPVFLLAGLLSLKGQQPPNRFAFGVNTSFADKEGHIWQGQECPIGATSFSVPVSNPDYPVFNNLCYSIKPMLLDILVNPGSYLVRFYFIEQNSAVRVGTRTFNITVNEQVKKDFDIYKTCGFMTACQTSFVISDVNGKLSINLTVTKYNAVLSGIEIIRLMEYADVIGEAEPESVL